MIKYIFNNITKIRFETIVVIALMILTGFMEMLTVGLIFSLIKYANGNEISFLNIKVNQVSEINSSNFIFGIMAIIIFGLFKLVMVWLTSIKQSQLIYKIQKNIQIKILEKILSIKNENKDGYNYTNLMLKQAEELTTYMLIPFTIIFSELVTVILLLLLLAVISTTSFLIFTSIVVTLTIIYYKFNRIRNIKRGELLYFNNKKMSNVLFVMESDPMHFKFASTKKYIKKEIKSQLEKNKNVQVNQRTSLLITKSVIEIFALISILALVIYLYSIDTSLNDIASIVIIYTIVSLRILPSLNKISVSTQELKYSSSTAKNLRTYLNKEIENGNFKINNDLHGEKIIELNNININSIKEEKYFNDLNLTIKKGDKIILDGPSGVGKSSLIKKIMLLSNDLNGEIILFSNLNRRRLMYVSGLTKLIPEIGVLNNLSMSKYYDKDYYYKLLKIFELEHINQHNESVDFLSTGELQRINLIKCLLEKPDILILDEAFSGIDERVGTTLLEYIIKELPDTVLIYVSHHIKLYKLFNIVIYLDKNKKFEVQTNNI